MQNKINEGRRPLVFCLLLLTCVINWSILYSQPNCCIFKSYKTNKPSLENLISYCLEGRTIYYTTSNDWEPEIRCLKIFSINSKNDLVDSSTVYIPDSVELSRAMAISISGNYLLLMSDINLEVCRFVKDSGTWIFLNKIKEPDRMLAVQMKSLGNNNFLLYSTYLFHPDENKFNTSLAIYDASKNEFTNVIHPELPCIALSPSMQSWLTVSSNLIALANPCGYKIRFYDFNLKLYDSIVYNPGGNWKSFADDSIPTETDLRKIHIKLMMYNIFPMLDTTSIITKIFFTDDNNLMVISSGNQPSRHFKRIDLWKIANKQKPSFTALSAKMEYEKGDIIDVKKLPLNLYSDIESVIKDNRLYKVTEEDYLPKENISYNSFLQSKDIYYETREPFYTISVYQIIKP